MKATKTTSEDSSETKTTTKVETTTTTESAATTAASEPDEWTLAAYTGRSCDGDYDFLELHGSGSSGCYNIRDLGSEFGDTGASCQYYTDGGFSSGSCASSPDDMKFWSFVVTGGTCTIYEMDDCNDSKGINFELETTGGCKKESMNRPNWGIVWGSLKCSTS
jgi:hypothetical protein